MTSLFDRCKKFWKTATELKVSLVENDDPFLKQLSELKDYKKRVELVENYFKKLGEGSSRTIFKMDDNNILKVAHNEKGEAQNLAESDPKMQRDCTNPIVSADAEGKWLIMHATENITKERFKELTGLSFDPFMNAIYYKFNNESDKWTPPRDYEEIEQHPLFNCVAELIFDCDLQIGDTTKPDSWGEINGKPVLRDTGLTREIFKDMYADPDSSTSSSSPKTST